MTAQSTGIYCHGPRADTRVAHLLPLCRLLNEEKIEAKVLFYKTKAKDTSKYWCCNVFSLRLCKYWWCNVFSLRLCKYWWRNVFFQRLCKIFFFYFSLSVSLSPLPPPPPPPPPIPAATFSVYSVL